jgi:O-antigen/teichoic acid export membrane protein
MFYKLNVIILQYLGTAQEVGWYSAAFKLIEGTFFVPSIFIGSLFPFLCENNERNTITESGFRLFMKGFLFLAVISVLVALAVTFLSGFIIQLLFGLPFMPAANALKVLVWSLVFIYVNELFTYLFLSIDRQKSLLKILAVALAVYLLSSVILIPKYGFMGAAMVLLITQGVLFLLNVKLLMRVKC